jgi:hypothetical protein
MTSLAVDYTGAIGAGVVLVVDQGPTTAAQRRIPR